MRGVFGGTKEPPSELAVRLTAYVEALVALGGLAPHVDDYLADPQGFEPPEGSSPEGLMELPLEAQMYLSCFVVQCFLLTGSTNEKEAKDVMIYVLKTAGRCTDEQAMVMAKLGMSLRGIILKDPEADEDWERELRAYGHIAEAAAAAGQAFMARDESDDSKPAPAEIEHFLLNYIKEDERAAELQKLAEQLSAYTQRLTVAAIMMPNLEAALADSDGVTAEKLVGKGSFGWGLEAQIFLVSLILEVCASRGLDEDEQIASVVSWVVAEGLKHPDANFRSMISNAAQLRHLVLQGDGAEDESEEVRKLIPIAAQGMERGKTVAARLAAGDEEIPDAELEDFVARFAGQA
ncbi:MAG: hypothetical protein QNJ30_27040 [Kiloniellales bacterium]|nr:hypothetical protein [Kiloniellales bacterium]